MSRKGEKTYRKLGRERKSHDSVLQKLRVSCPGPYIFHESVTIEKNKDRSSSSRRGKIDNKVVSSPLNQRDVR